MADRQGTDAGLSALELVGLIREELGGKAHPVRVRKDGGVGFALYDAIVAADEDAVDVLLAARAAYDRFRTFPPRDGWSEAYVGDRNGGVDRRATAELERLEARLTRILEPWTVEE